MSNNKIKNRIEFNFYPDDKSYEQQVNLGFEVEEGMHAAEFHRLCRYFGLVLGYQPETIDKYFGDESDDDLW